MPSVQEAISTFLKIDRSSHSTRNYTYILEQMSDFVGGKRDVKRVRYEDVLDFLEPLKERLKEGSVRTYLSIIQAFFNWCVKRGYVRQSPVEDLRIRVEKRNDNRAVPPEDLAKMVEYARLTSRRNYAIILFLVDTGCRVGGLSRLTLNDLDLERRTAVLREKGNRLHRVYFTEETANALRAWLHVRPDVDHNYVWTGIAPHNPLTSSGLSACIRALSVYAGASRVWGPHAIRHAVGHAMAKAGLPVSAVQYKLGHETSKTTMDFYFPHDEAYMRQIADEYPLIALRGEKQVIGMPRLVPRKDAR